MDNARIAEPNPLTGGSAQKSHYLIIRFIDDTKLKYCSNSLLNHKKGTPKGCLYYITPVGVMSSSQA